MQNRDETETRLGLVPTNHLPAAVHLHTSRTPRSPIPRVRTHILYLPHLAGCLRSQLHLSATNSGPCLRKVKGPLAQLRTSCSSMRTLALSSEVQRMQTSIDLSKVMFNAEVSRNEEKVKEVVLHLPPPLLHRAKMLSHLHQEYLCYPSHPPIACGFLWPKMRPQALQHLSHSLFRLSTNHQ